METKILFGHRSTVARLCRGLPEAIRLPAVSNLSLKCVVLSKFISVDVPEGKKGTTDVQAWVPLLGFFSIRKGCKIVGAALRAHGLPLDSRCTLVSSYFAAPRLVGSENSKPCLAGAEGKFCVVFSNPSLTKLVTSESRSVLA